MSEGTIFNSSDFSYETISESILTVSNGTFSNESDISVGTEVSSLYQIVAVSVTIMIFVIGLLGNILVIVVVCRTKSMHSPTNCYLISLAIADIVVLISATFPSIPEPFFKKGEWRWGHVGCSLLIFLQYMSVDASALSITAFTIERYIAICHPMKAQRLCTVSRAKRIIAFIWIFSIIYCSPWLGLTRIVYDIKRNIERCDYRLDRNKYLAYYMTDFIAFYVLPLLLSAVLYALIAKILFMTSISKTQGRSYNMKGNVRQRKSEKTSRTQVVRMLIVIVIVFASLWLPYRGMVVYNSFAEKRYVDKWFLLFCRVMVYINSAINPILYNAMSVKFRRAFRKVLCCGSEARRNCSDPLTEQSHDTKISLQAYMRQTCGDSTNVLIYKCSKRNSFSQEPEHCCEPDNGTIL